MARNEECFMCHQELANVVKHKAAEINCDLCHVGHEWNVPKKYAYNLKKPVTQLCQTCHKTYSVGHFQKNHANNGKGKYDPFYPANNFTCTTCHNPHQSKMPKLIRYDYKKISLPGYESACNLCHEHGRAVKDFPTPPRNGYGDPMDEETPTEVRVYTPSSLSSDKQNYFDVSVYSRLFGGFNYILYKNGKVILETKAKKMPSMTEILTEISKHANDGDLVRLSAQDYVGPIQVGIAPVKQLIVESELNPGDANIVCPAKKDCVKAAGKESHLRGLKISRVTEDFFSFTEGAKREFILIVDE